MSDFKLPGIENGKSFFGNIDIAALNRRMASIQNARQHSSQSFADNRVSGVFEKAARSLGRLEAVWTTLPPSLQSAVALHNRLATALELGRNLGFTSTVDIVLAHHRASRDASEAEIDATYQAHETTHLTHVPPVLFDVLNRHDWVGRAITVGRFMDLLRDVEASFKRAHLYAMPRVRRKTAKMASFQIMLECIGNGDTLRQACDTWLQIDEQMSNHIFWRCGCLMGLVAGLASAQLVPYPALNFFGSFSEETFINRKGRSEKLLYLAGCLQRSADASLAYIRALQTDVVLAEARLQEAGLSITGGRFIEAALPYLFVHPAFTTRDLQKWCECSASQSRRLAVSLLKAGVIGEVSGKLRYRRFRTHKFTVEQFLQESGSLFF